MRRRPCTDHRSPLLRQRYGASGRDLANGRTEGRTYQSVYVDVAGLQSQALIPRIAYYRHLRGLVDAGFGKRIMFGSDFPDQVGSGIDAVLEADFLSADQKADILCNNAARFLRLNSSLCAP